jgi:hypothetical protein
MLIDFGKKKYDVGWWVAKFNIFWEEDRQAVAQLHVDVFIAHRIIKPILSKHKRSITLWQFHRRAGRDYFDKVGHEFEFRFISSQKMAQRIFKEIGNSPILKRLKQNKILNRYVPEQTKNLQRPNMQDTSDKGWPEEIQRAWPFFINGVCRAWLDLIEQITARSLKPIKRPNINEEVAGYISVAQELNALWGQHGQHAFLHHLNAVFGYQPLPMFVPANFQANLRF